MRLTIYERTEKVKKLLGPELSKKYSLAIDYGARMRFSPEHLAFAIRRADDREKRLKETKH